MSMVINGIFGIRDAIRSKKLIFRTAVSAVIGFALTLGVVMALQSAYFFIVDHSGVVVLTGFACIQLFLYQEEVQRLASRFIQVAKGTDTASNGTSNSPVASERVSGAVADTAPAPAAKPKQATAAPPAAKVQQKPASGPANGQKQPPVAQAAANVTAPAAQELDFSEFHHVDESDLADEYDY